MGDAADDAFNSDADYFSVADVARAMKNSCGKGICDVYLDKDREYLFCRNCARMADAVG